MLCKQEETVAFLKTQPWDETYRKLGHLEKKQRRRDSYEEKLALAQTQEILKASDS